MYWLYVCLFVSALDAVFGAVAIHLAVEKPEELADEEGCYIPILDQVLPYDDPYSPQDGSSCTQYLCRTDNITNIFTCGAIAIGDGCVRVLGNKFLAYPKCCDSARCNHIDHEPKNT